jgi:hypothetical protein
MIERPKLMNFKIGGPNLQNNKIGRSKLQLKLNGNIGKVYYNIDSSRLTLCFVRLY